MKQYKMNRQDIERLSNLEVEIKNLDKQLSSHCKEQRKDFDKVFNKLDALDGKFASKWVEKVTIGIIGTVIAGIALLVIQLI